MTSLYLDRELPGPGIHALIIGVGRYPFATPALLDEAAQDEGHILTSAPISARYFAERLADDDLGPWSVPVASIDLLVSHMDTVPGGGDTEHAEPSIQKIRAAFDSWLRRCASHPENIAVFYFCGHGIQAGEQVLLAEDFGSYQNDPWLGAFGFDSTRENMIREVSVAQYYFIDACRVPSSFALRSQPNWVRPLLVSHNPFRPRQCRHEMTLRAPTTDQFGGARKSVSHFTAALASALDGQAASQDPTGMWVVSTDSVGLSIDTLFQRETGTEHSQVERQSIGSRPLRRILTPPETTITVWCNPDAALELAALGCVSHPNPMISRHRPPGGSTKWQIAVPAGSYSVSARFHGPPYTNAEQVICAEPPERLLALQVSP